MFPKRLAAVICCLCWFWAANALAQEVQKKEWRFATLAPKGIGWAKHIQEIVIPALDDITKGQVSSRWYWGGIMGDDEDYLKKMRIGQLDGMAASAQGMNLAIPEMQVLSLPFLFNNWEELDHVRRVMYPVFDEYAESHGIKLLYWADQDFDQIYSTDWEFNRLEDFQQAKFVAWFGPLEEAVLSALGANAIPINVPEVPSAIRQGVVNADICPSVWVIGTQVYSVFKYINPTHIRYSPAGIIITQETWQGIPAEWQQKIIDHRQDLAVEFCRRARLDSEKAVKAMVNYGLKLVEVDPEATARIREQCRPMWEQEAGRLYPKSLLDEIIFQLEQYRKANH